MPAVVAGVDVGGDKKGCNLVILRGMTVLCSLSGLAPEHIGDHCLAHDVVAVGVDAPCVWRGAGGARLAERELARSGISLFSTPARAAALANTSGFYGWMFNGERVFQALAATYPLLLSPVYGGGRVSFETFPHAITSALLGKEIVSAKQKAVQRRQLLEISGCETTALTTIDALDAALCALAASRLLAGRSHAYGDANEGYIHVPTAATRV